MKKITGIRLNLQNNADFCNEIIFYPVNSWIKDEMNAIEIEEQIELNIAEKDNILNSIKKEIADMPGESMILCQVLPFLPAENIFKFMLARENGAVFHIGGQSLPAAFYASAEQIRSCTEMCDFEKILFCVEPESPDETYICKTPEFSKITDSLRKKYNAYLAHNGVIIWDSGSTYISPEARIEAGAMIMPNSMIYGKSVIKSGAQIGPNSLVESSTVGNMTKINNSQIYKSSIGNSTSVGPFAYIRPDCVVGSEIKVGDFVELKNAKIGDYTKISHLTYIGDAIVGENVNFGCGTVTVNYDGNKKYITQVGDGAFIGCNTNLIAPVKVGDGAYTAAGSTITKDVPDGALVIARAREVVKDGWVYDKGFSRLEKSKLKQECKSEKGISK